MPHSARISTAAAAALVVVTLTAGCSVSFSASSPAPRDSNQPVSSDPAGPSQATTARSRGVSVDTLVTASTRPAVRTSATIKGDATRTTYDNALSLWAGCEGASDEVTLDVAGRSRFEGSLGLRTSAPGDIAVHVLVTADGRAVQNIQLDGANPTPALVPLNVVVDGHRTITLATQVVSGTCSVASDSYAVLVDGYVS